MDEPKENLTGRIVVQLTPLLLTYPQVSAMIGMCQRHIARLVSAGDFPKPKKLGKLSRWRRTDIEKWVEEL